ncbi:MAG: hypothetical protein A3H64_01020 [Candidatus Ryanbacteria bacterium RIFCSPLOWO2_02_FULL_45_11c]|uniref:Uncharacterized protein n=1 Tax=Candidatus Ryanbacteria bacterium RIFCSPLOWO2_02_FULL_45_11c TaxID=1802128 RepID=A0A1G2H2L4_9BACT|nr:MAG: hypothetical protein A3H64_01020 [Candidatus Ryanbacteria bacterium RIFCSPLOWO2_02_FULL_45_11c]
MSGGGVVLFTITATPEDVVIFPAASRAVAVNVCDPFDAVVLFHVIEYGEVVSSAPRFAPSSLNCTPATPTLSLALAEIITEVPDTVEPDVGAVMDTIGAVVSAGGGLPEPRL